MLEISEVQFGNGEVTFNSKVDPVPASRKVDGNVTINNAAIPGSPAYYDVSFTVRVQAKESEVPVSMTFITRAVVLADDGNETYRQVESEAARRLAPMLRAVADRIEEEVARFDAEAAAAAQKSPQLA